MNYQSNLSDHFCELRVVTLDCVDELMLVFKAKLDVEHLTREESADVHFCCGLSFRRY
jgi:hypothetical protein